MTVIHVPKPDNSIAMNRDRQVSSLLLAQIKHLRAAERDLPLRHHTQTYVHAIKTEGEAADYIRDVTKAIHKAHDEAKALRARAASKRQAGTKLAAAGQLSPRPSSKAKAKKGTKSRGKK